MKLSVTNIKEFADYLCREEKSMATQEKYLRDAQSFYVYANGSEITKDMIGKVVIRDLDFIVFSILDYFLAEKPEDGFRALGAVIKDGEKPLDIARVLGDKAKLTLEARKLIDRKKQKDEITKSLPVSPGYAYRIYESARRLKAAQVPRLFACAKALAEVAPLQLTGRMKASDALERALLKRVAE